MERSFPRDDRPMVPHRGNFAGEAGSSRVDWRDAVARRRYIEDDRERLDTEAQKLAEERAVSRRRFTEAMKESTLLPFYHDPMQAPKRALETSSHSEYERWLKEAMDEELGLLEEALIARGSSKRRQQYEKQVPTYALRWQEQADDFDIAESSQFRPRTVNEQRLKDSTYGYARWRLSGEEATSPQAVHERVHGYHPAQSPRYKDIDRSRRQYKREPDHEVDGAGLDQERFTALAKERQRDKARTEQKAFDYRPPATKLSLREVVSDRVTGRASFKYPDYRSPGTKWDSRLGL